MAQYPNVNIQVCDPLNYVHLQVDRQMAPPTWILTRDANEDRTSENSFQIQWESIKSQNIKKMSEKGTNGYFKVLVLIL